MVLQVGAIEWMELWGMLFCIPYPDAPWDGNIYLKPFPFVHVAIFHLYNGLVNILYMEHLGKKKMDRNLKNNTPSKLSIAPEKWCLEDEFPFGIFWESLFSGAILNFTGVIQLTLRGGRSSWKRPTNSDVGILIISLRNQVFTHQEFQVPKMEGFLNLK